MNKESMLSIITPVLNGADYIEKNIKSVLELSIPYEHIIVDGGSSDGTIDILKKSTHLITLNQSENTGMYGAIDMGFKRAKGKYICWVNCDDVILKEGFERMFKIISTNNIDLVYSNAFWHMSLSNSNVFKPGVPFGKYFLKRGTLPFTQPSSVWTNEIYQNCGGLNYKTFKIIGDKDLFVRMAFKKGFTSKHLNISSTIFLKHGDSLGDNNVDLYKKELKLCPSNQNIFGTILIHFLVLVNVIIHKIKNIFDRSY